MPSNICTTCGLNPSGDLYTCTDCTTDHEARLNQIPTILKELTTEIRKDTAKTTATTIRTTTGTQPLPLNLRALEAHTQLTTALAATWTTTAPHHPQPGTPEATCSTLHALTSKTAGHPDGGNAIARLKDTYNNAIDIIDLPQETIRVGNCDGCDRPIYPPRTATFYACPQCRKLNDVAAKLTDGLRRAATMRLTPDRLEKVTIGLVKASTVRRWRKQGKLTADDDGRVQLGHVLHIAEHADRTTTNQRRKNHPQKGATT